eukprot:SAG31_NODE_575_length_13961_cov_41.577550_5_plen_719_part_00
MEKRKEMAASAGLRAVVKSFWRAVQADQSDVKSTVLRDGFDADGVINFSKYMKMHMRISRALQANFDEEDSHEVRSIRAHGTIFVSELWLRLCNFCNVQIALADWRSDLKFDEVVNSEASETTNDATDAEKEAERATMDFETFFNSMLELADVWTAQVHAEELVQFLVALFKRITIEARFASKFKSLKKSKGKKQKHRKQHERKRKQVQTAPNTTQEIDGRTEELRALAELHSFDTFVREDGVVDIEGVHLDEQLATLGMDGDSGIENDNQAEMQSGCGGNSALLQDSSSDDAVAQKKDLEPQLKLPVEEKIAACHSTSEVCKSPMQDDLQLQIEAEIQPLPALPHCQHGPLSPNCGLAEPLHLHADGEMQNQAPQCSGGPLQKVRHVRADATTAITHQALHRTTARLPGWKAPVLMWFAEATGISEYDSAAADRTTERLTGSEIVRHTCADDAAAFARIHKNLVTALVVQLRPHRVEAGLSLLDASMRAFSDCRDHPLIIVIYEPAGVERRRLQAQCKRRDAKLVSSVSAAQESLRSAVAKKAVSSVAGNMQLPPLSKQHRHRPMPPDRGRLLLVKKPFRQPCQQGSKQDELRRAESSSEHPSPTKLDRRHRRFKGTAAISDRSTAFYDSTGAPQERPGSNKHWSSSVVLPKIPSPKSRLTLRSAVKPWLCVGKSSASAAAVTKGCFAPAPPPGHWRLRWAIPDESAASRLRRIPEW